MENITYSYAAPLRKRIDCWQKLYSATEDHHYFERLKERKSLLTLDDYGTFLELSGLDEEQMDIGLSSLNEEKAMLLLDGVEKEAWFLLHKQLFTEEQPMKDGALETALRFHIKYYHEQMARSVEKYKGQLSITAAALSAAVEQLEKELFMLARKTLAWDVHQVVEACQFTGLTKEEEFEHYINEYLGTKESVYNFFSAYPVLAKLLAARLQFACENFEAFIAGVVCSAESLAKQFKITLPLTIDQLNFGQGDSHAKGKSVIQFRLNGQKLVFKFKSLVIGDRFNQLLDCLEETIPIADFYKIRRISKESYAIEEHINYTACVDEKEIEVFYSRYGQLLAVAYWLGATDLHMENIIACGAYPVLIDIETIIRPTFLFEGRKKTDQQMIENASILVSGLVPKKYSISQSVNIDALSGQRQKLPYKIRQLQQTSSSDIAFEWVDGHMEGAQNIPLLNDEVVDYMNYRQQIIDGFNRLNSEMLAQKELIVRHAETLFSDIEVRVIYRDTQDYADYLMFASHPECMSNYVERERVIANLWRTDVVPKKLITEEIDAMLVNDIPFFTINSSETVIRTEAGLRIEGTAKSPLETMLQHMNAINENSIRYSLLLLKESLQLLSYKVRPFFITERNHHIQSGVLQKAADIGDLVVEKLLWGEEEQGVLWMKVSLKDEAVPAACYPGTNLYDGLGGIYLFLMTLNHFAPKQAYQCMIDQLEKQIFNSREDAKIQGLFTGLGMRLLLDFFAAELLNDKKYEDRLYGNLLALAERELPENGEWIYGSAGICALLCEIYRVYSYPIAKELVTRYADEFVLEKDLDSSFAHGYAGILYSMERANELLKDDRLLNKIGQCKFMLLSSYTNEVMHNHSWCRGITGLKSVMTIDGKQSDLAAPENPDSDDCICHGRSSVLLGEKLLNSVLQQNNTVFLSSDEEQLPLDLFTGISGIGYQLLVGSSDYKVRSILFLDKLITV